VYAHQERWDGTGYPEQLSRQEIPQAASIIAVGEAFSAMTTEMPYRDAMSQEDAVVSLKAEAGTQFDPEIVDAFAESLADTPPEKEENAE
jgi:HD-GYP domain-containing protein (c-di-GMP phosphodiesterase class II)